MASKEVQLTLSEAVDEVQSTLTGLDVQYNPAFDRFKSVTRFLNRALRAVALEKDWSWYASTEEVGTVVAGLQSVDLNPSLRPRIISDDAVRLVDANGTTVVWAYFLPRDAIHKYASREGFWVATTRTTLTFNRPLPPGLAGLRILVPAMREPRMFRLPEAGEEIPDFILNQAVDFDYPDLVVAKAAQLLAETDPIAQPRVQTLEAKYKDLMYQLVERDDRITDQPYLNEILVPISNSVLGGSSPLRHGHPHADERWR